jgi:chromate transporter
MASRGSGVLVQIIGAIAGGTAIFLPGILLIYFVYPLWENLKKIKVIKTSLKGITAVAGGLISVSALILMQKSGFTWDNLIVFSLTAVMLLTRKIPAPVIVAIIIAAGFLINPF